MSLVWLCALVLFLIIEIATVNLVTIWFAAGSLLAFLLAVLNLSLTWQVVGFMSLSAILLLVFILVVKPRMAGFKSSFIPTNADRIIGQTGHVIETIDPDLDRGQIKVMGQVWSATSETGDRIEQDSQVTVVAIHSVKAVVRRLD